MRTSIILGVKADQTSEVVSVGPGPDIDAEFRAIRRGESKCEGFERVELWTRAHGRTRRFTLPEPQVKEVKKPIAKKRGRPSKDSLPSGE